MVRCSFWQYFEEMQRKLRLKIYPPTIVWINMQTYVALQFFYLTAHGQHGRADATQTAFDYLSTDYRLDQYSNVSCVAVSLAYRSRQDVRGGNATQATFEYLSTDYRLDKYSNACCLAVFLHHREDDLTGIGTNSNRKWSPE